jgi:hypothetical protein
VSSVVQKLGTSLSTRPDLTILAGDQVYLDQPLGDFPDDESWLRRKFHEDYKRNWFSGLAGVLTAAPAVHMADDHEYWNNFPHRSPIVANSFSDDGCRRWRAAAASQFAVFQDAQGEDPSQHAAFSTLDIAPLSFFFADLRSQRAQDRSRCFSPQGLAALEAWAKRVKASGSYGVFVSGQSLLNGAVGGFTGRTSDWELANYGDYKAIMAHLDGALAPNRSLVCLTGDVHWGRLSRYTQGTRRLVEVISSPLALVSDPRAAIKGFFQPRQDFPRHSDAEEPPPLLVAGQTKFSRDDRWHGQRGDHCTLLSFTRNAKGMSLRVTYYPIHPDEKVRNKTATYTLDL